MDVDAALRTLGLTGRPPWDEIRRAHREAITSAHPDAGGSADTAARVNQALDLLRAATDGGKNPLPTPPPPAAPLATTTASGTPMRAVHGDPVEVLMRLADAAHEVGDVVFVDPHDMLLEVVVGEPPGVGQLTASVSAAGRDGVPVAFTLEPLGIAVPPPIHEVVDELMALVRRRERSGSRPRRAGDERPR